MDEFDKVMHTTNCKKCGEIIDVGMSGVVQRMTVQNKALKEENKILRESLRTNRLQKVGQIQVMHKTIKRLLDLMTKEQKENAYKISRQMANEMKAAEKK
jgi:hypothetical protein